MPPLGPAEIRAAGAETWPPAADAVAYFNNDQHAAAPADAAALAAAAERAGWPLTARPTAGLRLVRGFPSIPDARPG